MFVLVSLFLSSWERKEEDRESKKEIFSTFSLLRSSQSLALLPFICVLLSHLRSLDTYAREILHLLWGCHWRQLVQRFLSMLLSLCYCCCPFKKTGERKAWRAISLLRWGVQTSLLSFLHTGPPMQMKCKQSRWLLNSSPHIRLLFCQRGHQQAAWSFLTLQMSFLFNLAHVDLPYQSQQHAIHTTTEKYSHSEIVIIIVVVAVNP